MDSIGLSRRFTQKKLIPMRYCVTADRRAGIRQARGRRKTCLTGGSGRTKREAPEFVFQMSPDGALCFFQAREKLPRA